MVSESIAYLDWLYNKYGPCEVCCMYIKDGDRHSSKWHDYLAIRDVDSRFTERCNNRSILHAELVLDIDDPYKVNDVREKLYGHNLHFKLFQSNKGFHVHMIFPEFALYAPKEARRLKERLIEYFGTDLMKSSPRTMIALEYCKHWKGGRFKSLIEERKGLNTLNTFNFLFTSMNEE